MNRLEADKTGGCGGRCSQRDLGGRAEGDLQGWRLVLPAAGAFLLPLVLATAGAAMAPADPTAQVLWAGAGFAVGILAAVAIGRIVRRAALRRARAAQGASADEESL